MFICFYRGYKPLLVTLCSGCAANNPLDRRWNAGFWPFIVVSPCHTQNIYKCIKSVHYFAVLIPDKENKMSSEKARFQVVADRSRCCGYGLCAAICPSIYKLDADGLVYLDDKVVPPELEEEAREGAAACPAEAIWLEDITAEGD